MTGCPSRFPLQVAVQLLLIWCVSMADPAVATLHSSSNGLSFRLYSPDEITADWLVNEAGRLYLQHPAVGRVELLTGPGDARNLRRNISRFWPFSTDDVKQAMDAVHTVAPQLEVAIFCLPMPPVEPQSSFARRSAIILAPGYSAVPATTIATLCTHELGHVLTWAYLDPYPDRWRSYLEMRGISTDAFGPNVPHAERAREILAEDFRFLFGGPLATSSGTVENHQLRLPNQIAGLQDLLAGYCQGYPGTTGTGFRSRAFPNPCNPATTIEMVLPHGYSLSGPSDVVLTVFDIRGRQIRRIHNGMIANGRLAIQWDGRDDSGQIAASGRYVYQLCGCDLESSGSVLLVR